MGVSGFAAAAAVAAPGGVGTARLPPRGGDSSCTPGKAMLHGGRPAPHPALHHTRGVCPGPERSGGQGWAPHGGMGLAEAAGPS